MELVVNMTTKKYNNKNQITYIKDDQNSMTIGKKKITKSNSHQKKLKTRSYASLEIIVKLYSRLLDNRSKKKSKKVGSSKIRFNFYKKFFQSN